MATNWDSEMQDKFDKLQAALTDEFRTQFGVMGAGLEERLEQRLRDSLSKDLTVQLKAMGVELEERLEQRLDARLGQRLNIQAEQLREIVKTAADNYGGVLDSIKGELTEFRNDWRKETEDTRKTLANHGGRIDAIEKTVSTDVGGS